MKPVTKDRLIVLALLGAILLFALSLSRALESNALVWTRVDTLEQLRKGLRNCRAAAIRDNEDVYEYRCK